MKKVVSMCFGFLFALGFLNRSVFAVDTYGSDASVGVLAILSTCFSLFCSAFCYCIPAVFGLVVLVAEIIMIMDIIKRDDKDFGTGENAKLLWLLIVLLTGLIGTIIYYFMIYSKFKKKK